MNRNTKTILIIDDEPKTCLNLSKMLNLKKGYSILTASNGQDAIKILEETGTEFDTIITDMYMPNGTGLDVITYVRNKNLEVDIILISGGDRSIGDDSLENDKLLQIAKKYCKTKFLKKPCQTDDLSTLI